MSIDDEPQPIELVVETAEPTFGSWMKSEMERQKVTIRDLEERTGLTYVGIWNIWNGNTKTPRQETRTKIATALNKKIPEQVEAELREEAKEIPGFKWVDFTPSDLETIPEEGGVYVFYDVTDRPVYVGKSGKDVRGRVKDHQTRFWFKPPLVVRGAFVAVSDPDLCRNIESMLIKFLGKHALLNEKGVKRDPDD